MFQIKVVEKFKTRIFNEIISSKNRTIMTLCGKSGGARGTTDDTVIWRTRFACWITTASRHTFRLCNTYDFSTDTRMRLYYIIRTLPLVLYEHSLKCVGCQGVCKAICWQVRKRRVEFGDSITWYIPTDVTERILIVGGDVCTQTAHAVPPVQQLFTTWRMPISPVPFWLVMVITCQCQIPHGLPVHVSFVLHRMTDSSSSTKAFPCQCHSLSNAHICCVNQRCCTRLVLDGAVNKTQVWLRKGRRGRSREM
jgi:hypothetical protein